MNTNDANEDSDLAKFLLKIEDHFLLHTGKYILKPTFVILLLGVVGIVALYLNMFVEVVNPEYYTIVMTYLVETVSFIRDTPVLLFTLVFMYSTLYFLYSDYEVFHGGYVLSIFDKVFYFAITGVSTGYIVWAFGNILGFTSSSILSFGLYIGSLLCSIVITKTAFAKASGVTRERLRKQDITFSEAHDIQGLPVEGFYPNVWRYVTKTSIILSVVYVVVYGSSYGAILLLLFSVLPAIVNFIYFLRLGFPKLVTIFRKFE